MPSTAIRDLLSRALAWQDAHVTFDDVAAGIPVDARGVQPAGLPYSAWQLLEHLRITQRDILDFCVDASYAEKTWPDDYWPPSPAPESDAAWQGAIRGFVEDRKALQALAADTSVD